MQDFYFPQVPAATSSAQRACGGATAIRPVSSIAPTVTHVCGKPEHVCVAQVTGELPARTVSVAAHYNNIRTKP